MSEALVVFDKVTRQFDDVVALRPLNLEIRRGEFLALTGPPGCGKSTILRLLAGLESPSAGELRWPGRRQEELEPAERRAPLIWPSFALFPFLNVARNVEFGMKVRGLDAADRQSKAMAWLERLEIARLAKRDVAGLSGGQRLRVALARALATEPEILLLDEPLAGLEEHHAMPLRRFLAGLQKDLGITFVYADHSRSEAFAMADRVAVMSPGTVEQVGPPRTLYDSPASPFVAGYVGANNVLAGDIFYRDGDSFAIKLAGLGVFTAKAEGIPSFRLDRQGAFVVAADLMVLGAEAAEMENKVDCTLSDETFTGSKATLYFKAAKNGQVFKAQMHQRERFGLDLAIGDAVTIGWRPEQTGVLPGG